MPNSEPTQSPAQVSLMKRILWPLCEIFLVFVAAIIVLGLLNEISIFSSAFSVIDGYLRLILTSWPAIILILGLLLLIFHSGAVDNAIRRLIKAGPVELEPQKQDAEELRSGVAEVAPATAAVPATTTPATRTRAASNATQLQQENETLRQELEIRTKSFLFEKTYRLIFGGQLRMLQTAFYSTTGAIQR